MISCPINITPLIKKENTVSSPVFIAVHAVFTLSGIVTNKNSEIVFLIDTNVSTKNPQIFENTSFAACHIFFVTSGTFTKKKSFNARYFSSNQEPILRIKFGIVSTKKFLTLSQAPLK